MKICMFSGLISIDKNNTDVRKNYLLKRLKYFVNMNCDIELIIPATENMDIYESHNIKYSPYRSVRKKGFRLLSAIIFPFNKLVLIDCEIMHCFNYQSFLISYIANMFRKKKYVLIFEAMGLAYSESLLDSKSSLKVRLIKFLINYFESFSFHKSDYVVVYTEILKDYTSNHFQIPLNKIYVIPHGVDLDLKVIPVNIPEVNFNYSSIIMYVGSLSELHGTPDLMNIILNTSNKKNDLLFIILGFGPLMSKFIKFVDDYNLKNVLFLGHVPSDHVLSYMSLADVLLIPHSKCLQTELDTPTKLFEYLKAAKPIVSFDYKAIREVVGDQASLVNPGDLDAFVDTIIDVLDRKKYYLNIARKAVSITEHFSWKKAAEKQFEMYQSIRSI